MIYDEFRVVLTPDTATSGSWNVLLDACPPSHTKLAGEKGAVQVAVTRRSSINCAAKLDGPTRIG